MGGVTATIAMRFILLELLITQVVQQRAEEAATTPLAIGLWSV